MLHKYMEEVVDRIERVVNIQASKPREKKEGQRTTPQYSIQIPKEVALQLGLEKGDKVIFTIPLKDKSSYTIKFEKDIK